MQLHGTLRARFLSLWAAMALLLMVSGAWAQSRHVASAQSKGIDPTLLAKAKAGDPAAEFRVGYRYQRGKGVSQNYAQAAVWFRKAAEQGNAYAQSSLGSLYSKGHGVRQDYAQAA